LHFQFERGGPLTGVTLSTAKFRDASGITVGSSVKAVREAYGAPLAEKIKLRHNKGRFPGLVYEGITFMTTEDKVTAIHVGGVARKD